MDLHRRHRLRTATQPATENDQSYHDRQDASSMVTAGATANSTGGGQSRI